MSFEPQKLIKILLSSSFNIYFAQTLLKASLEFLAGSWRRQHFGRKASIKKGWVCVKHEIVLVSVTLVLILSLIWPELSQSREGLFHKRYIELSYCQYLEVHEDIPVGFLLVWLFSVLLILIGEVVWYLSLPRLLAKSGGTFCTQAELSNTEIWS